MMKLYLLIGIGLVSANALASQPNKMNQELRIERTQPLVLARHHPYESRPNRPRHRPGSLYNYGKPLYPGKRYRHPNNQQYYYQGHGRGHPQGNTFYYRHIERGRSPKGAKNCYQNCTFTSGNRGSSGYSCVTRCD